MDSEIGQSKTQFTILKKFGLFGVSLLVFLTLVAALPVLGVPFYLTKVSIAFLVTLFMLVLFLFSTFKEKRLNVEVSVLRGTLFALPIAYLVATLFSTQPMVSFIGERLETDTFAFILIASLMAVLVSVFVRTTSDNLRVLTVLLFSGLVAIIFQIIQVAFGGAFGFLGFSTLTDNVVGRWKDLGLLAGLIGSLSLITLELLPLQKKQSYLLIGSVLLSLVTLIAVNSSVAWTLFGLVALGTFTSIATKRFLLNKTDQGKKKTGIVAGVSVLFAVLFLFFGGSLVPPVERVLNIQSFEVRPSIQGTVDVMKSVYADNALFGAGPNTFSYQWALHKPEGISQTPFWNVTFNQGSGFIPTTITTGGMFLALFWLLFIAALFYTIIRVLFFVREQQKEVFFVQLLTSIGVLYLLFAHIFYSTGQGLTILFFVFVGLLIASLRGSSLVKKFPISFAASERFALLFVIASIVIVVVSVGALYGVGRVYIATYQHERGLQTGNAGDLVSSKKHIERAIALYPLDRYYRSAALVDIATMNVLANSNATDPETTQQQFQAALASGLENTNQAITRNPNRFENWMTRGSVISFVLPAAVEGAYENALATYEAARLRAPDSPEVDLRIAQVHVSQLAYEEAKTSLEKALQEKPDYTDAILLRANIALRENNLDEAITSLEGALFFNPQNAELLYQTGILHLQNESYALAATAFELALGSSPEFANAAFFLAQAYTFLDRTDEALQLMQQLQTRNPENQLVGSIVDTFLEGGNPFTTTEDVTLESSEEVIE